MSLIKNTIDEIKLPYKILIYDIETSLILAYLFSLGEQRIGHNQLFASMNINNIICISYKWYDSKTVYTISGSNMLEEFDTVARQADICIGKNNIRFDMKHINTHRMLQGLRPYPEWIDTSDDLESQLRKYFTFPSQSLDYISQLLGLGGKEKMDFSDWVDIANLYMLEELTLKLAAYPMEIMTLISEVLFKKPSKDINTKGKKALKKMYFYNKKDVRDTDKILKRVLPYIKLKRNAATEDPNKLRCITCGSDNIEATKKIVFCGQTKKEQFYCHNHNGYAGKAAWYYKGNAHRKVYKKMG